MIKRLAVVVVFLLALALGFGASPTHTTPTLNSTYATNSTSENITVYNESTADSDGDSVKNIINWYRDGASYTVLNVPMVGWGGNGATDENDTTRDYSGYANNGTIVGNMTWNRTGGHDGQGAYEFNGTGGYITFGDNSLYELNQFISVEAWFLWKGNSTSGSVGILNKDSGLSIGYVLGVGVDQEPPQIVWSGGDSFAVNASATVTQNQWYHVVGTYDGENLRIYLDGTLQDTTPKTDGFSFSTGSFEIGRGTTLVGFHLDFNGTISEVRVYDKTLTAQQIEALYNNKTDTVVSQSTIASEQWYADVTPNDGNSSGTTLSSNTLTIVDSEPTQGTPILNTTNTTTNDTVVNLTVFNVSTDDSDNHTVKNIINWYLNESSLTVLTVPFEGRSNDSFTKDYSGYGFDGTVTGASWLRYGGYDGRGAYTFDGIDDVITFGDQSEFEIARNISIEARVRWLDGTDVLQGILTKDTCAFHGYCLFASNDNGVLQFAIATASDTAYANALLATNSMTPGRWYHVVVTYNGTTKMMYLDGEYNNSINTSDNDIIYSTGGLFIGRAHTSVYDFNGTIDDLRIYNRTLSAEQAQALYNDYDDVIVSNETTRGQVWRADITPVDHGLNGSTASSNNLTILNARPTHDNPILNASLAENFTLENLTVYNISTFDLDGDPIKNIFTYYIERIRISSLVMPFEGDGNQNATDYSGYENNGTVTGAVWNQTGGYDSWGAYIYDGDDFIDVGDNLGFEYDEPFSVIAWINPNSLPVGGASTTIVSKMGNTNAQGWAFDYFSEGNLRLSLINTYLSNDIFIRSNSENVSALDTWHHVAVTYNGSSRAEGVHFYLNGEELNTTIDRNILTLSILNSDNARIGARANGNLGFDGLIDDVQVFNASLTKKQIKAFYENDTHVIEYNSTIKNQIWEANVTPNDGMLNGVMKGTNNLTIRNSPPNLSFNVSVPEFPVEDDVVYVTLNVTDDDGEADVKWANFTIDAPNGSTIIDNVNGTRQWIVWNSSTFSANASGVWNWTAIVFDGDDQNSTSGNFTILGWHFVYGNVSGTLSLQAVDTSLLIEWDVVNETNSNIYAADSDSSISFNDLQSLGLTTTNGTASDDFENADTLLNMTLLSDSINTTYTSDGNPTNISNYTIFGTTLINVSIYNSTNNTNFFTGILWDTSDDVGDDGQYDTADSEDIVFVSRVHTFTTGTYGVYDYELRIPATLREYTGPGSNSVSLYAEIK